MEDQQIIRMYIDRDEEAIVQTSRKYGTYCFRIAHGILKSAEDSEEAVNDTWLRAWDSIPPSVPVVLKMFLAKITRNLAFSRYRMRNTQKRGSGELELALDELSECIGSGERIDDALNLKELGTDIRVFLDTISVRDKDIFIRRYFFVDEIGSIAHDFAMRESTVLMSLSRTRKRLKNYLIKEGYEL